jgi:hypothetical protein
VWGNNKHIQNFILKCQRKRLHGENNKEIDLGEIGCEVMD